MKGVLLVAALCSLASVTTLAAPRRPKPAFSASGVTHNPVNIRKPLPYAVSALDVTQEPVNIPVNIPKPLPSFIGSPADSMPASSVTQESVIGSAADSIPTSSVPATNEMIIVGIAPQVKKFIQAKLLHALSHEAARLLHNPTNKVVILDWTNSLNQTVLLEMLYKPHERTIVTLSGSELQLYNERKNIHNELDDGKYGKYCCDLGEEQRIIEMTNGKEERSRCYSRNIRDKLVEKLRELSGNMPKDSEVDFCERTFQYCCDHYDYGA